QLERAWNGSTGAGFGDAFAADATFVDIRGGFHQGARAIAAGHQALFDSIYAGSTVAYRLETARTGAPSCVVAVAGATLDVPSGPMQGTHRSTLTAIITQQDDRTSISSFHNTLVREGS